MFDQEIPILYMDDQLVVIDKPAGMLVHRSDIDRHETVFVLQQLRNQLGRHVYPVHRLDKPTSGILVFGLDSESASSLAEQFALRQIDKGYWLVCRGYAQDSGEVDYPLVPRDDFQSRRKKRGEEKIKQPPQDAVTEFTTLARTEIPVCIDKYPSSRYSLVKAEPKTGRKHQIRRHFKHLAHPIIGDVRYGKGTHNRYFAEQLGCERLLLHAQSLTFSHPLTGEHIRVECMPGGEFASVLEQLQLHP